MTSTVRRASAFAAVSTLSLTAPLLGPINAAPVAALVLAFAFVVTDGVLFEVFARPGDHEEGRLQGLASFVLAATALGIIAAMSSMTVAIFVGTVVLVGYGNLAEQLVRRRTDDDFVRSAAFVVGGLLACAAGQTITYAIEGTAIAGVLAEVLFLSASGALLGALLRDVLFTYDDPLVMLSVGLLLWLLAELSAEVTTWGVVVAIVVTAAVGYLSYALETASVAGMLTGVLLSLLTIVLGGYAWFAVLISFFALGGLSTKYRYEQKATRGVAEENNGARGSANVLGNAAIALAAVVGYAASVTDLVMVDPLLFLFAFTGSVATALSDTLSSEIGGAFDTPRLITTFEPVEPGTDGGVTWQGEVAGLAGAAVVAGLSLALFPTVDAVGAAIIVVAGFLGMTADSLLGATVEGGVVGNQTVNFLATLVGAAIGALLALSLVSLG